MAGGSLLHCDQWAWERDNAGASVRERALLADRTQRAFSQVVAGAFVLAGRRQDEEWTDGARKRLQRAPRGEGNDLRPD